MMIEITTGWHRNCERIARRDFLRVGALTALGLGLGDLLAMEAAQAEAPQHRGVPGRAKGRGPGGAPAHSADAVILLWLGGGMSQIDTFDPKPDAQPEIRGHFGTLPTKLAGVRFSDRLPRLAQTVDRFCVIRSMTHTDTNHGSADHLMLSGYLQTPTLEYASYGAVAAKEFGYRNALPPFIALPRPPLGAGYLGAQYNAFTVGGDPNAPDFTVRDVRSPAGVSTARRNRREALLNLVDGAVKAFEEADGPRGMAEFTQRAYAMVTSPTAREAFALEQEPERIRRIYGRTTFGQSALLARRLVERGARFVNVTKGGWDHHANIFTQLDEGMLAELDQVLSALLIDLEQRGLLSRTLVLCMGEFGRTPNVNYAVGRDHWPQVASVVVAGGGVRGGQILGASDGKAAFPAERAVTPGDLAATIYHCLGIDVAKEYDTRDGRPIKILAQGEVIPEIL